MPPNCPEVKIADHDDVEEAVVELGPWGGHESPAEEPTVRDDEVVRDEVLLPPAIDAIAHALVSIRRHDGEDCEEATPPDRRPFTTSFTVPSPPTARTSSRPALKASRAIRAASIGPRVTWEETRKPARVRVFVIRDAYRRAPPFAAFGFTMTGTMGSLNVGTIPPSA